MAGLPGLKVEHAASGGVYGASVLNPNLIATAGGDGCGVTADDVVVAGVVLQISRPDNEAAETVLNGAIDEGFLAPVDRVSKVGNARGLGRGLRGLAEPSVGRRVVETAVVWVGRLRGIVEAAIISGSTRSSRAPFDVERVALPAALWIFDADDCNAQAVIGIANQALTAPSIDSPKAEAHGRAGQRGGAIEALPGSGLATDGLHARRVAEDLDLDYVINIYLAGALAAGPAATGNLGMGFRNRHLGERDSGQGK